MSILHRYQQRWLNDTSWRKLAIKARRIGFSFTTALEIALCAAIHGEREYIVSATHTQAKDLLTVVDLHLRAMEMSSGQKIVESSAATEIKVRHKSGRTVVIRAMSSRPSSLRGPGGNLTLDEFAHVARADEVWKAAGAIANPHIGRPQGYRLRVISTPSGDDNQFWKLACTTDGDEFSRHHVNVYDAIEDGFPADIVKLRKDAGDPDIFEQEYNCSFLSSSMRYISAALYDSCVFAEGELPEGRHLRYGGFDVGAGTDRSALVQAQKHGDTLWAHHVETRQERDWDEQEAWLAEVIPGMAGFGLDATGIGDQFAQRLEKAWGSTVIPVGFTLQSKETLATGLKLAMRRHRLRVCEDLDLRRDVLNLRREVTRAGNVRYDAPRDKRGHSDSAWALALMVHAAGGVANELAGPPVIGSRSRRELPGDMQY